MLTIRRGIGKTLAVIFCLTSILSAGNINALAEETVSENEALVAEGTATAGECGTVQGTVFWSFDDATSTLTISGNGTMANPGNDGLGHITDFTPLKDRIEKVKIETGVTNVADGAFESFGSLTEVSLPTGLTAIGSGAFRYCGKLKSIVIPNGVTVLNMSSFMQCFSLESITLPDSLTTIDEFALDNCTGLTSIRIPAGVNTIAGNFMQNVKGLTSIEVDDANTVFTDDNGKNIILKKDDKTLVLGCKNSVIPSDVKSIGTYAFSGCEGLGSLSLPNGLEEIGSAAFAYCSGLTELNIPDSVYSIGLNAFIGCGSLQKITVGKNNTDYSDDGGNNVLMAKDSGILIRGCANSRISARITEIGESAFSLCSSLKTIDIPQNVKYIRAYAFWACPDLQTVTIANGTISLGYYSFYECPELTKVSLPVSLKSVGMNSFNGCSKLRIASFANPDTTFDSSVFKNCDNVKIYGVKGSPVENFAAQYGIPFGELGTETTQDPPAAQEPVSVVVIKPDTFGNLFKEAEGVPEQPNTKLTDNKASYVVKSAGQKNPEVAITGAKNTKAKTITTPNTVTLNGVTYKVTEVKEGAYSNMKQLKKITITGNITKFGKNVFKGCKKLQTITIKSKKLTDKTIRKGAFKGLGKGVTIKVPKNKKKAYKKLFKKKGLSSKVSVK